MVSLRIPLMFWCLQMCHETVNRTIDVPIYSNWATCNSHDQHNKEWRILWLFFSSLGVNRLNYVHFNECGSYTVDISRIMHWTRVAIVEVYTIRNAANLTFKHLKCSICRPILLFVGSIGPFIFFHNQLIKVYLFGVIRIDHLCDIELELCLLNIP